MKKYVASLLMMLMLVLTMQAQSYDQLWKKVEKLTDEDLPKSAIVEAQRIYDKAKSERNVPQMMKACLTVMTFRGQISPDSIPVDVKGLEAWAESPELKAHEKAVLYSILGGVHIYKDFEQGDRFLKLSLKDSLALIDYPAEKMVPMVQSMETSRMYMDDNLLDLLARRAIDLWKDNQWRSQVNDVQKTIRQTYQMLARQYERVGNRAAWVLTTLDACPNASEAQLKQWIAEYGDLDVCAEVYLRLADDYQLKRAERIAYLREAIKRYPRYTRINALKNEERELASPYLNVSTAIYPGEGVDLTIHYRELKGLTLNFYRLDLPMESEILRKVPSADLKQYGKLFSQEHIALEPTPDFEAKWAYKKGKPLPAGIYYWEAVPDGYKSQVRGDLVHVTGIGFVFQNLGNRLRMTTVDRKTGHPIPHVEIVRYEEKDNQWERKESYRTNEFGGLVINTVTGYYQARLKNDSAMKPVHIWKGSPYRENSKRQHHVRLFTDRSIYRPGQQVHYSGLAFEQWRDSVWVKTEGKYKVVLWDADRKEVASQEVTTDEFGAFNGTFDLPKTGKLGNYQLKVDKETMSFRVEAYKRPTFEVTFDTVRANYQAGDSIQVKGRAYTFAGIPVQGAVVKYKIHRKERVLWRGLGYPLETTEGETLTDAQGLFEVPLRFSELSSDSQVNDYEVSADVTSLSGETQNGGITLPLGRSSLLVDIADRGYYDSGTILKEERKTLNFKVTNLQNFPVSADVEYRVYVEKEDEEDEELGACVLQGKAKSNRSFVPEDLYALPSGTYRLKFAVRDEKGRKCEQDFSFVLFSNRDKQIPCDDPLWVYQPQTEFNENGEAVFYYGTREKDVTLILDRFSEHRTLGARYLHISNSLLTFRCKYKEEWGNGLRVVLSFVKNGQIYSKMVVIKKPEPKKQLAFQWKTFRDKLCPGSQEQWTLRVLRPDGTPADARLLATMYDASLDALSANNWSFRLNYNRTIEGTYWQMRAQGYSSRYFSFPVERLPYDGFWYSRLFEPYQWPVVTVGYGGGKTTRKVASVAFTGSVRGYGAEATVESALEENQIFQCVEEYPIIASASRPQVKFRENFAETAFFYPQLRTDANGEVNIAFTLPESLTEWKFMGMAHTKDMFFGNITEKVVARKEFMVQPNMPRFVRVGDQVTLAASLVNVSDKEVKGMVKLELFVPETEKVVLTQERPFKVNANETEKVSFSFDATDEYEGLGVRIVADGDSFSDGEQHYLPVLSNKQKLMESVLLHVNGKGTFTYSLESLFNQHSKSVTRPQMWVEFTGNPLWYAIQSLKVVGNPDSDNVLSWATAYYANALLAHLAKTEPRLADSLNVEGLDAKLTEAVWKLKDLQRPDGSWSWFKGMSGSRYMTVSVVQLVARLQEMTGGLADAEIMEMYQRAWGYLNKELEEEVRWMKEAEEKGAKQVEPSETALQCLYADALNKQGLSLEVRCYLVDKLEKMSPELTIYGKALSAIILQEAGKKDKAKKFLKSLMEYSVTHDEMGRYFDTPKAQYSWFSYRIPTQVAAIEAIKWVTNETKTQEEMKQWLLKQKQAQVWETPVATTDAVYALLTTGEDWLSNTGEGEIKIGKEKISIREGESLGYVSRKIKGNVMDIPKVTVKKKGAGIAWGAVYAEFEEAMDEVSARGNALKVAGALYKDGKPLAEGDVLQVGDRLTVRLTITTDRDMDFVQVKDERAACMEPVDALSGYRWNQSVVHYREHQDSSTSFFIERLRKGTHILEYEVYVTSSGQYIQGVPTVQSVYAPEFRGHGESRKWIIE